MSRGKLTMWRGWSGWRMGVLICLLGLLFMRQGLASTSEIKPFERASLHQIAIAQGSQPYWLVLWDLNCPYCMVSLKNLAALQKADPKLRVVTVSTDSMDDADAVRQRLNDIGVKSGVYVFGNDAPETLRFAIDPAWRGEKPRSYFYPGKGPRRPFSGILTEARILGK